MPSITNLYSGFSRASRYQRVEPSTIDKALKPYSITRAMLRGLSDSQLRNRAISAVLTKRGFSSGNAPKVGINKPPKFPTPAPTSGGARGSKYQLF